MLTDHQVYRNGWHMIKTHGTEAHRESLRIAAGLAEQGEKAESEMWSRVASAVEEIARSIPGMALH
ncbi:MAG TPA: hypothetical protein VND94_18880 [Terriglobia bacterium]|nr:hypothetical protein [Terriglobia bacterium]